jgi:type I restriction enzyme R subunit
MANVMFDKQRFIFGAGAPTKMVADQFTMIKGRTNRRPDNVIFVNGLPLCVIELKNAAAENATLMRRTQQQ